MLGQLRPRANSSHSSMGRSGSASRAPRGVNSCRAAVSTLNCIVLGRKLIPAMVLPASAAWVGVLSEFQEEVRGAFERHLRIGNHVLFDEEMLNPGAVPLRDDSFDVD